MDGFKGDKTKRNEDCSCLSVINPVCAENGKTYMNECLMECDKQRVLYYAACIG